MFYFTVIISVFQETSINNKVVVCTLGVGTFWKVSLMLCFQDSEFFLPFFGSGQYLYCCERHLNFSFQILKHIHVL
jgi:hypothetical protein